MNHDHPPIRTVRLEIIEVIYSPTNEQVTVLKAILILISFLRQMLVYLLVNK